MAYPTTRKTLLFHVGLGPGRGKRGAHGTHEGAGLSVSQHPEEWRAIARLGGQPVWKLRRRDRKPGRFVSWYGLTDEQLQGLWSEALRQGLVAPQHKMMWTVWDSEFERFYEYVEQEISHEEYLAYKDEGYPDYDAFASIEDRYNAAFDYEGYTLMRGYTATPKLKRAWRARGMSGTPVDWWALLLLLESTGQYDGVWWDDVLAVSILSAPRGTIFQSKLPEWEWRWKD